MPLEDCTLCLLDHSNCPTSFSCGDAENHQDLADFILNDALQYQEEFIGTTRIILTEDETAIGYFTLCSSEVKLKLKERSFSKVERKTFPAVKLAQVAIQREYQAQGLGRDVIRYVVGLGIKLNQTIGCRFILVDAIPESVDFYTRLGFEENLSYKKRKHPSLRLDIFNDLI